MDIDQIYSDPLEEPAAAGGSTDQIGLCLSGGGYRAMVFHLGSLWRLNEAGLLKKIDRFSSVSGGSITAGVLGMNWDALTWDAGGKATNFEDMVAEPIFRMASQTIDLASIASGVFWFGSVSDYIIKRYKRYLFGERTLQNLPDEKRFIFCATNVQSLALWRFSKPYMGDYRVGLVKNPDVSLAEAVACSSAFPPVLSPHVLDLDPHEVEKQPGNDLHKLPYIDEAVLSDGGVYDNMGIEPVWKRCKTVLVSDAGGKMSPSEHPGRDWARHGLHVLMMGDNQVRNLRKRQVVDSFRTPAGAPARNGAFWSVRSHVADYGLADPMTVSQKKADDLALLATRLAAYDQETKELLVNWGYAITDTAIRRWVDPNVPKGTFPFARGVQ